MRRLALALLILLVGGCATAGEPVSIKEQAPPAIVAEPTSTTTTTSSTTTIGVTDTVPLMEGDGNGQRVIERADPVRLSIPAVQIDALVVVTGPEQTNACGKKANPCQEEIDLWVDSARVGPCEIGPSFFTGHLSWGKKPYTKPDSFTNLIDDQEHSFDDGFGVQTGDEVIAGLADGTSCVGTVVDFVDGPGQKIEGTPARYFDKMSVLDPNPDTNAATQLTAIAKNDSLGFLFTSYCGQECNSNKGWYQPGEIEGDNSWHRRYNAVVMVKWQLSPEEG